MKCEICGKKLQKNEEMLCPSCLSFVNWKYGGIENYQKSRKGREEK
jgi:RecJ-like exonuclease